MVSAGLFPKFENDVLWLTSVLELWDGICCLFAKREKPWVDTVIKFAQLFCKDTRQKSASVENAEVSRFCLEAHVPIGDRSQRCLMYVIDGLNG